jgi:broad specificity phosphatase PhoE
MSLLLVRHGQASAGTDDYDRLSARGVEQATRLGHWLAGSGQPIDGALVGGMRRHRQTFEAIAAGYVEAGGAALPEPLLDACLDEFDHHAVFDSFARDHADHPAVAGSRTGGLQALGALIHAALGAWSEDRIAGVPETWQAFGERVGRAGAALARHEGEHVLVVTSGGVISRLAQAALGASDRAAVDLNLSLRNSAVCEFHLRPYGLALGSFNTLPHLHDRRDLWTYY